MTLLQPKTIIKRKLVPLSNLPSANMASDVTAIIGYSFDPGDVSKPITDETIETARAIVRQAAGEGALWLDADTGITNFAAAFIHDPALSYYPLARAIIAEAHELGLKVFFYFSTTEIETPDFANQSGPTLHKLHPEWLQLDQWGRPMVFEPNELHFFWLDEGTASARMNPLSPGFREAIFERAERVAALGADGLFFDVPYFFTLDHRWTDFSPDSAAAFRADTGYELPRNLELEGKRYHIWLDWRHKVWVDFFKALRERVRSTNPETLIIVEEFPGANPAGAVETGLDPALLASAVDVVAHEYDHRQDEGGAFVYSRADWQHTRNIYKRYQGMNPVNWSLCYATQANDSRALAAISYTHQQSFWETRAPTMLNESAGLAWRRELLAWVAKYGPLYSGAEPVAEIAVIYSSRTQDLTYAANMVDLEHVQHALDQASLPYVILTEPDINRIYAFPYVIFPNVTYATEAVLAEVKRYTGQLLLTGQSLTRDGWNENDLQPPATLLSVEEAITCIETTPLQIEGGQGLFIELFRRGSQSQIRLFNPELDEAFQARPRKITLRFRWTDTPSIGLRTSPSIAASASLPHINQLDFMAAAPISLSPTRVGDVIEVQTEVGLATLITVEGQEEERDLKELRG